MPSDFDAECPAPAPGSTLSIAERVRDPLVGIRWVYVRSVKPGALWPS